MSTTLEALLQQQVQERDVLLIEAASMIPAPDNDVTKAAAEDALAVIGAARSLALKLAEDMTVPLKAWIRAADAAGMERKRIARTAGVTRPTVYGAIERH